MYGLGFSRSAWGFWFSGAPLFLWEYLYLSVLCFKRRKGSVRL